MTSASGSRTLRCAVYTRKSSEEGLDQAFNSLDAQREAALDYIKSQRHEGWTAIGTRYDDGGFSGGNTDRPGLKRLLQDVASGRVDIVLVYKVDRLSRSLSDFAGLMRVFDEHRVSFVSVTQQFNTTTSMGRLTLNMLLSFAQFEREVAGERIRDKIAATKKKGVWVTGPPPIGYRVDPDGVDRRLVIVPEEAKLIRAVFEGYLELGSLLELARRLNQQGFTTRRWTSSRERTHGGRALNTAFVYRLLTNPVYVGLITHTARGSSQAIRAGTPRTPRTAKAKQAETVATEVYPGLHEPIIERALWDRVQEKMKRIERQTSTSWTHSHLLKGKIRTSTDDAMSPGSVQQTLASGEQRRIAYYISQKAIKQGYASCPIKSINARHLDDLVRGVVLDHLRAEHGVQWGALEPSDRDHRIREAIARVVLAPEALVVELDDERLMATARDVEPIRKQRVTEGAKQEDSDRGPLPTCPFTPEVECQNGVTVLTLRVQIKRHDGRRILVSPEGHDLLLTVNADGRPVPKAYLISAIGQAFALHGELLRTRDSIERVSARFGFTDAWARALLDITALSPRILNAALTGTLPPTVTLKDLREAAEHLDWSLQEAALRV